MEGRRGKQCRPPPPPPPPMFFLHCATQHSVMLQIVVNARYMDDGVVAGFKE